MKGWSEGSYWPRQATSICRDTKAISWTPASWHPFGQRLKGASRDYPILCLAEGFHRRFHLLYQGKEAIKYLLVVSLVGHILEGRVTS